MPSRRQDAPEALSEVLGLDIKRSTLDRPAGRSTRGASDQLSEVQRARIVAAMLDVAAEQGVGKATIARVIARSGVSRRTFYEVFGDREDCFLAAFDQTVESIAAVVVPAYERSSKWPEQVRAGLTALLRLLEAEPGVGRIAIVETLGAGPRVLERRQRVLEQVIAAIDEGGRRGIAEQGPPPLTAEGVVGGALSLIHTRMASPGIGIAQQPGAGMDGGGESLIGLLNPLVSMIVLPYRGPVAAHREMERPVPEAGGHGRNGGARRIGGDPLRDLEMRLTYRTIRVLLAIGERGEEPSNRQVADAAGIRDQGQVSKLLARLEQLGLVENASGPQAKGEPNAWKLTQRGEEIRAVVSV